MRYFAALGFIGGLTFVFAAPLTVQEKKAVRREMIESDIALRNLASIIATSDRKMLDDTLTRLVTYQIKDHPELGKTFRTVVQRWEASGAAKFGTQIQREASAMRDYTNARAKFNADDWARISQGMIKIMASCRGCHDITRKDKQ